MHLKPEEAATALIKSMREISAEIMILKGSDEVANPLYALICVDGTKAATPVLAAVEAIQQRLDNEEASENGEEDVILSISRNRLQEILKQAEHASTYIRMESEDNATIGASFETVEALRLLLAAAELPNQEPSPRQQLAEMLERVARFCEQHDAAEQGDAPPPTLCMLDWHRWSYKLSSVSEIRDTPPGHATCERCGIRADSENSRPVPSVPSDPPVSDPEASRG